MKQLRKTGAALVLATMMVLSGPFAAQAADLPKLIVNLGPDAFYYMLHYVADGAGYFQKEGVAIDLVTVNSGSQQVATVMGGSSDAAEVDMSVSIVAASRGADLMIIASIYKTFPAVVFLSSDAIKQTGITDGMALEEKIKRLHGLKIGITSPGSGTDHLMRSMFIGQGLDIDKQLSLVPLGAGTSLYAALKRKAIDGFVFYAPLPEAASAEGLGKVVISPFIGEVPEMKGVTYMAVTVTGEALRSKRPQLQSYLRALADALKLVHDDPMTARQYTRTHFATMDEAVFNAAFANGVKGLPDQLETQPSEIERNLLLLNLLDKDAKMAVPFKEVVVPDLARQADKDILGR